MYQLSSYNTSVVALAYGMSDKLSITDEMLDQSELSNEYLNFSGAKTFEEYLHMRNETLVNSFILPSKFERKKLIDYITHNNVESVKKDKELNKLVTSKSKDHIKTMLDLLATILKNKKLQEKKTLDAQAENYLSSNLPLSFFTNFTMFSKLEYVLLEYLEKRFNYYHTYLSTPRGRSDAKYRKHLLANMKSELFPLMKTFEDCMLTQDCLMLFISVNNADSYTDLFKINRVSAEKMDAKELARLSDKFKNEINKFKQTVSNVASDSLYQKVDTKSPVAITFFNIMSTL